MQTQRDQGRQRRPTVQGQTGSEAWSGVWRGRTDFALHVQRRCVPANW